MPIGPAPACASGGEESDGRFGLGVRDWRKGMGNLPNEIACDHAGLAELLRGQISGEAMKISGGAGGIPWREALSQ